MYRTLVLRNRGRADISSADVTSIMIEEPVAMTGAAGLSIGSAVTFEIAPTTAYYFSLDSGSTLTLGSGSTVSADRISVIGGTLSTGIDLDFLDSQDFVLSGAGNLEVLGGVTFSLATFNQSNIGSGTVNINSGARISTADSRITLNTGVTLIKNGALGAMGDVIGSLYMKSGSVMTTSLGNVQGLNLVVSDTLEVAGGSSPARIHADNLGNTASLPNNYGGSYGGIGAKGPTASAAYGVVESAQLMGSGGHLTRGGGLIHIEAGVARIYGVISANGETKTNVNCAAVDQGTGGGSGGSIQVEVSHFSGSGTIRTNGGSGYCGYGGNSGGGGGGGRIAVYYDSIDSQYPTLQSAGGSGENNSTDAARRGSAGSIYLRASRADTGVPGSVIYDNSGNESPPSLRYGLICRCSKR